MLRSLVIILGFGLLTLFPAWERATHWLPDPPLDEKRLPIPEPSWRASPSLERYLMAWQDWFNDRYSGRNLLIRVKTQLDYSLFSYSDRIYIGRDGWLFYRNVLDAKVAMQVSYTPEVVDRVVSHFRRLDEWLAARGIYLVIVDNPLKDSFYPEMLPSSAPLPPSPSVSDEIRQRLRGETGALFIDVTGILERLKSVRPVFHRTDFHWNDPAAFVVAEDTVDRMAALLGPSAPRWRIRLEVETKPNSGGEASFMPLLKPVTEESLFVRQTWKEAPASVSYYKGPFEYVHVLNSRSPGVLPPVVVMGDSFFDGMVRSGFAEHFSAIYRARIYKATLQDTLAGMPRGTRFVIVQFIESDIGPLTIPLDYRALDKAFPPSSASFPPLEK